MNTAIVTADYIDPVFEMSQIGLTIREDVTYDEWASIGKDLAGTYSKLQWAIGDWINFGERKFGEMYAQAQDDTHFAYGTLRNYASVCARIPVHNRHPNLKFHQAKHVACLEVGAQAKVIQYAVAKGLSGDEILEVVHKINGKDPQPSDTTSGTITDRFVTPSGNFITIEINDAANWLPGMSVTLKKGR